MQIKGVGKVEHGVRGSNSDFQFMLIKIRKNYKANWKATSKKNLWDSTFWFPQSNFHKKQERSM